MIEMDKDGIPLPMDVRPLPVRLHWWRRRRQPGRVPPGALLSSRALSLWRERPDLQAAFDLNLHAQRAEFYWWFLFHGFGEMGLDYDSHLDAGLMLVNMPAPDVTAHHHLPITWLIREAWIRGGNPVRALDDPDRQKDFLAEWFLHIMADRHLQSLLTQEQQTWLTGTAPAQAGLSRVEAMIWQEAAGRPERFTESADPAFATWCRMEGVYHYPVLNVLQPAKMRPRVSAGDRTGVNLIGFLNGRLGIGEDIRMAAAALDAANIPYMIWNAEADAQVEREQSAYDHHIGADLQYATNLFCMTGPSTITTLNGNRLAFAGKRRSIGLWPWELQEWPHFFQHAFSYVDEVWAASHYTYEAYALSSPVPVRHVPMAVSVEEGAGYSRQDFGLPVGMFLFAFAFDSLSTFARKNPMAVVRAFQTAFPDRDEPVGLVVKGLRSSEHPEWLALLACAALDPRIHIVTTSLPRAQLLDLYRAIDCFVSLHRSEGFGRNIAECMAVGKPVIVTAYSGNLDFTDHETAALVPARLRELAQGDYPFGAGQHWAQPDEAGAARLMRRMVDDKVWRETLALRGRDRILTQFSPSAVGAVWSERLHLEAT